MNRHFWQACERKPQSGLTLVELLVTIVIAGIAFAALVPVFVNAMQASAGDNARTVALGIAQQKLETIRGLRYDQVDSSNFDNGIFAAAHGLGNDVTVDNGNGTKSYKVDYTLTYIYDPASTAEQKPGYELYKQVTVDVYWVGNPRPVKHTLLKTDIYQQYVGPAVVNVTVSPLGTSDITKDMIVPDASGLVTITAYVETGVATREVRFTAASADPAYKKTFTQTIGASGAYVWQWQAIATGAHDGFYTISAVAVSPGGFLGNTWQITQQLETGPTLKPQGLTATPGDLSVTLGWEAPAAGDIAHYEVYRAESSDVKTASRIVTVGSTSFPDTTVANDKHYWYWVYAVDSVDNISDPATADATPTHSAGDDIKPTPPTLTSPPAVMSTSINLTWTPSTDASGIDRYEIFRSTDGITYAYLTKSGPTATTYSDPVGTGSLQYWYKVRAVDNSQNRLRSDFSARVVPVKTPISLATLTVTNNRTAANQPCTVTVYDPVGKKYYDRDCNATDAAPLPAPSLVSKGGSDVWKLPSDKTYTVTATYENSPLSQSTASSWTLSFK